MKQNNKNLILSICLAVLAITLIIIAFFIDKPNKNDNSDSIDNKQNNIIEDSDKYSCKLKQEQDNENYEAYTILTLYVDDDTVLSSESMTYLVFNNEDKYLTYKNDLEYSKDKEFNDVEKTVTFTNGDYVDLTKDVNGKDMELKYEDYEKDLNGVGFICSKN